jgi:hypothetical protein
VVAMGLRATLDEAGSVIETHEHNGDFRDP